MRKIHLDHINLNLEEAVPLELEGKLQLRGLALGSQIEEVSESEAHV